MRSGVWRYPSSEERELIMDFRRHLSAAIFSKQRRSAAPREYEDARLSVLGGAPHAGVMAFSVAHCLVDIEILSDLLPRKLVQARRAAVAANQSEEQVIRLLALEQTHRGREIRPFHLEAPGDWPRQPIEPRWWNWRGVFATPWRSQKNISMWRLFGRRPGCRDHRQV